MPGYLELEFLLGEPGAHYRGISPEELEGNDNWPIFVKSCLRSVFKERLEYGEESVAVRNVSLDIRYDKERFYREIFKIPVGAWETLSPLEAREFMGELKKYRTESSRDNVFLTQQGGLSANAQLTPSAVTASAPMAVVAPLPAISPHSPLVPISKPVPKVRPEHKAVPKVGMQTLTDRNFELQTSRGIWVVDLYTEWCEPCQEARPVLEKLAKMYGGKVKFGSAMLSDNSREHLNNGIARRFKVFPKEEGGQGRTFPQFVLLIDGVERGRMKGFGGGSIFALKLVQELVVLGAQSPQYGPDVIDYEKEF